MITRTIHSDFCWKISFNHHWNFDTAKREDFTLPHTNTEFSKTCITQPSDNFELFNNESIPSIEIRGLFDALLEVFLQESSCWKCKQISDVQDIDSKYHNFTILSHLGFFKSRHDCRFLSHEIVDAPVAVNASLPNSTIWFLSSNDSMGDVKKICNETIPYDFAQSIFDLNPGNSMKFESNFNILDRYSELHVFLPNLLKWRKIISDSSMINSQNISDAEDVLNSTLLNSLRNLMANDFCTILYCLNPSFIPSYLNVYKSPPILITILPLDCASVCKIHLHLNGATVIHFLISSWQVLWLKIW